MSIEAMKQALEALEEINKLSVGDNAILLPAEIDTAMESLRQAIAEAEKQEPVAYLYHGANRRTPLYTHTQPKAQQEPKREWVGLTDEEVALVAAACGLDKYETGITKYTMSAIARVIDTKLKEKNHG